MRKVVLFIRTKVTLSTPPNVTSASSQGGEFVLASLRKTCPSNLGRYSFLRNNRGRRFFGLQ